MYSELLVHVLSARSRSTTVSDLADGFGYILDIEAGEPSPSFLMILFKCAFTKFWWGEREFSAGKESDM